MFQTIYRTTTFSANTIRAGCLINAWIERARWEYTILAVECGPMTIRTVCVFMLEAHSSML